MCRNKVKRVERVKVVNTERERERERETDRQSLKHVNKEL